MSADNRHPQLNLITTPEPPHEDRLNRQHGYSRLSQSDEVEKHRFTGHETFPFRYTWLPKGVQGVEKHGELFTLDEAMVILGVGKNMVASIRHWCEALGLIESSLRRQYKPTELGKHLFLHDGWDPYLEDPATLWLLHWQLVRRPNYASTWHLAFTRFNKNPFTSAELVEWLLKLVAQASNSRATHTSLRRDVEVFLRTYVPSQATRDLPVEETFDCPLVELGLLRRVERDLYQFARGPKPTLVDAIFIYALLDFWESTSPSQRTISFETLLHGAGSPGGAFKLSENALVERLECLPSWTGFVYDDTAGMRVLLRHDSAGELDPLAILARYYGGRIREGQEE